MLPVPASRLLSLVGHRMMLHWGGVGVEGLHLRGVKSVLTWTQD